MLLVAPNRPLLIAPGTPLLTSLGGNTAQTTAPSTNPAPQSTPAVITGLAGWWDASSAAVWNSPISGIPDKTGASSPILPYHYYTGGGAPPAALASVARLSGLLGGVGASSSSIARYSPTLDPDTGLSVGALSLSPDVPWTHMLVWSRPNRRQGTLGLDANPVSLMTCAGVVVVEASSLGSSLTLFPKTADVTLSEALTRRHTHALTLRNTPGSGVDAWLDGVKVATGVTNPLPAGVTGNVVLLHDMTLEGAAQLWFHEFATWPRSLSDQEVATLATYTGRWHLGPRKGVSLLVMGQSNSSYFVVSGGAAAMANGLAWYMGALAGNVIFQPSGTYFNPARYTQINGHPISNSTPPLFPPGLANGTFLTNPGDGSDPLTWSLGPDGIAFQDYMTGSAAVAPTEDLVDIAALVWPWTEQDSTSPYSDKSLYKGTVQRLASLTRSLLGRDADNLPLLMWNAIPYETDSGVQMVREATEDIASEPAQNFSFFVSQTADSIPLGATYNATNGTWSGGDTGHRDETDEMNFGLRGAHAVARAALAAGFSDSMNTIPAGMPLAGPKIASATLTAPTEIVVTIVHDQGTDLLLPLQAMNGAGWALMDGGTVAAPGPIIAAISAHRIDATHIGITLATAPMQPASSCSLFYPYGSTQIGRGNAVTDNYSLIAWPEDWNMSGDLGSEWTFNFPLQATTYSITLT